MLTNNKIISASVLIRKNLLINLIKNENKLNLIQLESPVGKTEALVYSESIFFRFAIAHSFQLNLNKRLEYASQGYFIELVLKGIGFRGFVSNQNLFLQLGFSHLIVYNVPKDILVKCKKAKLVLFGLNKNKVTQIAAEIRSLRAPDVYKGKGILYSGEQLKLKTGKQR